MSTASIMVEKACKALLLQFLPAILPAATTGGISMVFLCNEKTNGYLDISMCVSVPLLTIEISDNNTFS